MARDSINLECTHEQFHGLHEALDKARENAKAVTVDRQALGAMLRDHGRLIRRYKDEVGGIV